MTGNVPLACFITSFGRLRLLDHMEALPCPRLQLIYTDTVQSHPCHPYITLFIRTP